VSRQNRSGRSEGKHPLRCRFSRVAVIIASAVHGVSAAVFSASGSPVLSRSACVSSGSRPLSGSKRIIGELASMSRSAAWVLRYRPFAPIRPCFQPKDLRRDIAGLGVGEQIAGDQGIGLGDATVEVLTTPLAQRLRVAPDDLGDVVLTDANPRQMANLFAYRLIHDKRFF
jgi:hypothetical protein